MCAAAALIDSAQSDGPKAQSAFSLHPPRAKRGLNPMNRLEFGKRVEAFRRLHAGHDDPKSIGGLFSFRIDQVRARFGFRWNNVREKAFAILEVGIDRGLQKTDLYLVRSANEVLLFITGLPLEEADALANRVAVDVTERLCGVVPGGNAIRVRRLKFDLVTGLEAVGGLQNLNDRIDTAQRLEEKKERRTFQSIEKELEIRYRPTLEMSAQSVAHYWFETWLSEKGHLVSIDTVRPYSVNGTFDAAQDCWSIDRAVEALNRMIEAEQQAKLILPIHYETLAAMRFRSPFLVRCRNLPEQSQQQLLFEVTEVPPGAPQSRVRELLAYLKPLCEDIVVRLEHDALFVDNLIGSGIGAISLDLDQMGDDDAQAVETLAKLTKIAEQSGFSTMMHNAWAISQCHQAMALGCHFLNGDAFMRAAESPGRIYKL